MGKPYSQDLRERVIAAVDTGTGAYVAALLFQVRAALPTPIEQFFAKLKALLRKVAARTIEALIAAIAEALTQVSPQECENYLANQGYRRQL